jgi:hypothetical protein
MRLTVGCTFLGGLIILFQALFGEGYYTSQIWLLSNLTYY